MLSPKRTKFRKQFKGRIHGEAKGGTELNFGEFGLKATEPDRITARQIEAARRALTRHMKRQGRVWIRVFPDVPVSKKPTEVRMGKGKGSVEFWAAKVKPGRIMFEIDGVAADVAKEALRLAAMKLPIKCRFVVREDWWARSARIGPVTWEEGRPRAGPIVRVVRARSICAVSAPGPCHPIGKKTGIASTTAIPTMTFIGTPIFRKSVKR